MVAGDRSAPEEFGTEVVKGEGENAMAGGRYPRRQNRNHLPHALS